MSVQTALKGGETNEMTRRDLLVRAMGGLVLGLFLPDVGRRGEAMGAPLARGAVAAGTQVNTWLRIGSDETITLTVGSSEMGQGSFSGLAQVMCEDLMVDYARISTVQGGPTAANPAPVGTAINSVGSGVTRGNYWKLRDAAASAREMLVQAAMNAIGDPTRANYTVDNGVITHTPSGATRTYGAVAVAAALLSAPTGAPLVPDSQFRVIGTTVKRQDIAAKIMGAAKYGIDVRLPNMLYGIVKHSPSFGGTLAAGAVDSSVAGRFIFYNKSVYDLNDGDASAEDDRAIAPDKSALLPGQKATFANVTSYFRGINGIMIDILGLPAQAALSANDFAFKTGQTPDPTTWTNVPAGPTSISVRRGAGARGSDRVTLIFADFALTNLWLQVTVKATSNTGLPGADLFYFGNLVGETIGGTEKAAVTISDVDITKVQVGTATTLRSIADFNRSGNINVSDVNIARTAVGHILPLFTAPPAPAPTPAAVMAVVPVKVVTGTGRGLEVTNAVNAVVVVGDNTWDTWQAAKRLAVTWNAPANVATLNSDQFLADAQALALNATAYVAGGANPPGTLYTVEGDAAAAAAGINGAGKIVEATYTLPYVAHACMEVLNCTVDYVPGVRCDIYAPTQSSKSALTTAMAITGMNASQVTVHTTYLGGGLGRKSEVDYVAQAVQVGMALGRPVKVMWPREEDFTRDQYRPMAVIRARAGIDPDGSVKGWSYRNVSPSILGQRGSNLGSKGDSQGIEGAQALPYNFAARVTEWVSHTAPIPVGFWRSVGASLNTFGVESMIDELAAAAGADPYLFRRNLLKDDRWIAVLDAAANLGGWNTPVPAGRARGIAIGTAFNSIVAEVVEISNVTATSLKVNKVSVAIDCYLVVNPGQVETQLIGGVVHGLNAALYGKQTFVNGVAQSKNFNKSRMIRQGEMPAVSVTIIPSPAVSDRTKAIGGVGELGVPTFAPALANAYFKLTGTRVRSLPFFPNATMGGL